MVSHLVYFTSAQMREMLGAFQSESHRTEVFVLFFLRVVDIWNSKIFCVRFTEEAELVKLRQRLGYVLIFPFMQPENLKINVDLSHFDERLVLNILLKIAVKEGMGNIRDPVFIDGNGVEDPLPLGVPRSWESWASCPKAGTFSGWYACAPENRKFKDRVALAENYASFKMDVLEEE